MIPSSSEGVPSRGLQGLRTECAAFQHNTKVTISFVRTSLPGHYFTTATLFHNTKTDLHSRGSPGQPAFHSQSYGFMKSSQEVRVSAKLVVT